MYLRRVSAVILVLLAAALHQQAAIAAELKIVGPSTDLSANAKERVGVLPFEKIKVHRSQFLLSSAPVNFSVQGICDCPSEFQSNVNKFCTKSSYAAPFCERVSDAHVCNPSVTPVITGLVFEEHPLAIGWFVIAVVIATIYGVFWRRPRPHVCKEALERLSPFFADTNASSAVIFIARLIRVIAPAFHPRPDVIFRRVLHSVSSFCQRVITAKAPTTFGASTNQLISADRAKLAAVALTLPMRVAEIVKYSQAVKFLSTQVSAWGTLASSHDVTSDTGCEVVRPRMALLRHAVAACILSGFILPSTLQAELKIVGPPSVNVGGMAFYKLEGAKAGEPFDFFSADGTLVLLFDVQTTPVGVVNGTALGSATLIGVRYDAESKKIQRVMLTVPITGVGPTPVPPTPVPPEPTPPIPTPPVVEGKRALLIIRESADSTPAVARMITNLRNPPNSDYLKSKGHTLSVLDDDAVDANGQPSALVAAWREQFAGMTLPVVFIIDPNGNKLIHKESLPATAGADAVMSLLKKFGG